MRHWTRLERRWRDEAFAAMIPASPAGGRPGLGDLSLERFWSALDAGAPPLLRLGFRVAVLFVTFAPWLWAPSIHRLGRLSPAARDRLLERLASSRSALVRQMLATVKSMACLAYFTAPEVREAFERASAAGEGAGG